MKTTTHLYNKTVPLEFDDDKHHYTIEGRTIDGVTSVLKILDKPALIPWAVNQAVGYMDKNLPVGVALDELQKKQLLDEAKKIYRKTASDAADLGTLTHEWCEKWIKGMNPEMPTNEILRQNAENFVKWATEHKVDLRPQNAKYTQRNTIIVVRLIFSDVLTAERSLETLRLLVAFMMKCFYKLPPMQEPWKRSLRSPLNLV